MHWRVNKYKCIGIIIVSSLDLQHRAIPEGRAMSPPLSAGLATHSPKGDGLGIVIGGGILQDGPHLEKILDGNGYCQDRGDGHAHLGPDNN